MDIEVIERSHSEKSLDEFNSSVNINIRCDGCVTVIREVSGVKTFTDIDVRALINMLESATKDDDGEAQGEEIDYTTGVLPNSKEIKTIKYSESKDKTKIEIVLFKKAGRRTIQYYDTIFEKTHIPNIIFRCTIEKGHLTNCRAFAVKSEIVNEDTKLYRLPLPNVGALGHICFGQNSLRDVTFKSNKDLFKIPAMFLSMPFNDDHSKDNNTSGLSNRKLFEKISKEKFDNQWLVETCMRIRDL